MDDRRAAGASGEPADGRHEGDVLRDIEQDITRHDQNEDVRRPASDAELVPPDPSKGIDTPPPAARPPD